MSPAVVLDPSLRIKPSKAGPHQSFGNVIEEIEGLIRVYNDGRVERPQIVPCVAPSLADDQDLGVTSRDIVLDKSTNVWARFYVPTIHKADQKSPLLVYFHGGGFSVGSAAWSCYHEFLSRLSARLSCLIMSVNYRLAPENPLPAAYEDGFKALTWLKRQAIIHNININSDANTNSNNINQCYYYWSRHCDFSRIFLVGDSAGANIAYNLATRLGSDFGFDAKKLKPLTFKGTILVQPFFGGESRTNSEKLIDRSRCSALSLAASDAYWRLALPLGANRDHPWCNPVAKGSILFKSGQNNNDIINWPIMVCISEMDILKDRNLDFCVALGKAGNKEVKYVVYDGVGHAFQILNKSQVSQTRSHEMMDHIKGFIARY